MSAREVRVAPPTREAAAILGAFAAGCAVYAAAISLLLASGAAVEASRPLVGWLARDAIFVALAAAAIAGAVRRAADRDVAVGPAELLIGAGLAWFALGLADMHLFGLLRLADDGAAADLAFHGAGSIAVAVGLALRRRPLVARSLAHDHR